MSDSRELIHFKRGIYRLKSYIVREVLTIGLSPCLMNLASCFVVIFINRGLLTYGGDYAVGAYGIVHKMTFVFVMIVMGFQQAMQHIAGYNYGAKLYSRVREVFWKTARLATYVTTLCFVIGVFIPEAAVGIFTHDEELTRIASDALRILTLVFPIVGFQMIGTNFFQSLGMVKKSIFLSLTRQLIFLLPCLYILPLFIGTEGVWFSFTVSDILSATLTAILIRHTFKKFNRLNDGDDPGILGSNL
jgi:Na+-driven multidrug efflux pump